MPSTDQAWRDGDFLTFWKTAGLGSGGPKKGTSSRAVTETCKGQGEHLAGAPLAPGAAPCCRTRPPLSGSPPMALPPGSRAGRPESPCRGCCRNRGSRLAPPRRRAGSWRRSCRGRRACSRPGRRWPRCRCQCAASAAAEREKRVSPTRGLGEARTGVLCRPTCCASPSV